MVYKFELKNDYRIRGVNDVYSNVDITHQND